MKAFQTLLLSFIIFGVSIDCVHGGESRQADVEQNNEKSGWVYVLSNKSFGEGVFKIGYTIKKSPAGRAKELSNASVPFPFVVVMFVLSDDPKELETKVHQLLDEFRLNPHKEFFKCSLERIKESIKQAQKK